MRIGIMLRSIDEQGGVGVYTRNIVDELLRIDSKNQYFLLYRNRMNIGLFSRYQNVTERYIRGNNKAYWDQAAIPLACRKDKIDLLFHPKFTLPLLAACRTVMTVHGADWFIPNQAQYYPKWDVRYMRLMMPLYFKKASAVISVSQLTTDNFNRVLGLPRGKLKTIYFAPARHFRRVTDQMELQKVKTRYDLPDKYILTLTKLKGEERKNLGQIIEAYARYYKQSREPQQLVIAGKDCSQFRQAYNIPTDGYGRDILFPGWIDQADMPAVLSMAGLLLYPSNLEAFPIPVTEAMACGTPVLTSNVNGLSEIAGDAALMVDPTDTEAIAAAISQILTDGSLRAELSEKGLQRSSRFNWDACAKETLALFDSVIKQ